MTAGEPIQPEDLAGDVQVVTEELKSYVAYELGDHPDLTFAEYRAAKGDAAS